MLLFCIYSSSSVTAPPLTPSFFLSLADSTISTRDGHMTCAWPIKAFHALAMVTGSPETGQWDSTPRLLHKLLVKKCPFYAKDAKKVRLSLLAIFTTTWGQYICKNEDTMARRWGVRNEEKKITYSWCYHFSGSSFRMRRLVLPVSPYHVVFLWGRPPTSRIASFPAFLAILWAPDTISGLRRTKSVSVFKSKSPS